MSDDQKVGLHQTVALLAYEMGYQPGTGQVVVTTLGTDRDTMAFRPSDTAATVARTTVRTTSPTRRWPALLVVAYGTDGDTRAEQVAAELTSLDPDQVVLQAHVHHGTVRLQSTAVPGWSTNPTILPDVQAEAAYAGLLPPAASREELLARVAPTGPTYDPAPTQSDPEPTAEARAGRATLDLLAQPTVDLPELQAVVARAVSSSPAVRDAVIAHAATDRARTEALITTYRGAPTTIRPAVAAAAATAMWLTGHHPVQVRAVLAHADPDLTRDLHDVVARAVHPGPVRDRLLTETDNQLHEAAQRWAVAHARRDQARPAREATGPAPRPTERPTKHTGPDVERGLDR